MNSRTDGKLNRPTGRDFITQALGPPRSADSLDLSKEFSAIVLPTYSILGTMSGCDRASLLSLPKELLLRVRFHIHGLPSHVSFSLTCRSTYYLYDTAFWAFACTTAGFGMRTLRPEQVSRGASMDSQLWPWAGLARIVVRDSDLFKGHEEYAYLHKYRKQAFQTLSSLS